MTIKLVSAKIWTQHNGGQDDPKFNSCSPNLKAIHFEIYALWGITSLGCYGERDIRAGNVPSAHSHGAAEDFEYLKAIGRQRLLNEVIPWLITNSAELHLSAIHDYAGNRVWHVGRTNDIDDAYTKWWKDQGSDPKDPNMGNPGAGWIHLETTETGWNDSTPIAQRLLSLTPTTPRPEDEMQIVIMQPDGCNAVLVGEATASGVCLNLRWTGPGSPKVLDALAAQLRAGAIARISDELFTALEVPTAKRQPRPLLDDIKNCWLTGTLPVDDSGHTWTLDDFAG